MVLVVINQLKDDKTLTVGIMTLDDTTEPLWDKVKELAKDKGVTIELKEFTDYNQPNEALKTAKSMLMLSNTFIS